MKNFKHLLTVQPGDKIAILSTSASLARQYKHVFELGLSRLRDFQLIPVIFPSTLSHSSDFALIAEDLHFAFQDPTIKGIVSCIGGNRQIKLISLLNAEVFLNNPKPFFGYSDNTHFQNYLWRLGIPSFYGGSLMTQYAMPGEMLALTVHSLEWAWYQRGAFKLRTSEYFTEEDLAWDNPKNLQINRPMTKNNGPKWLGKGLVEGQIWGGCLESLDFMMKMEGRIPSNEELRGCILALETSEGMPSEEQVRRFLIALGERGTLNVISGLVMGRPKAWSFAKPLNHRDRQIYREKQEQAVKEVLNEYNSQLPLVQNLDFGHTDPQLVLPLGGTMSIDFEKSQISVRI